MRILSIVALIGLVTSPLAAQNAPGVDVWMANPSTTLANGAPVVAHAIADAQAYVVVFRVTPDNRVVVVSPQTPNGAFRVPEGGLRSEGLDASFQADSVNGIGHLFVVASYAPFDFSRVRTADSWNTSGLRIPPKSNPRAIADVFVQQIVPTRDASYGVNDVAYYVGVDAPVMTASVPHSMMQPVLANVPLRPEDTTALAATQNVAQTEPQGLVVSVSQNNPYGYGPYGYNQYGYNPYGYNPYGYNPYGMYPYGYTPYLFNLQPQYEQSCPNGAIVPFNTACPTLIQREALGVSGLNPLVPLAPRVLPSSHIYWRLPAPNTETVVVQRTPPVRVARAPAPQPAPVRRYYVAPPPLYRGRRR